MAEMEIRAGGICAELNAQRSVERELLAEFAFGDDLRGPLLEEMEGRVGFHAPALTSRSRTTCSCSVAPGPRRSSSADPARSKISDSSPALRTSDFLRTRRRPWPFSRRA